VYPYARSKLRFKTFKIKYFQGFWAQNTMKMKPRSKTNPLVYSAEKEKFQIRFKVFPELSGKVEYERERLNTVLKCGRPYKKLYL
jgi:hypothetical protein